MSDLSEQRQTSEYDKRLGAFVRLRRLELGMSQERLAELLGITYQQVQKYERGANRIAASRLYDIALALKTPVAHFFEDFRSESARPAGTKLSLEAALSVADTAELVLAFAAIQDPNVRRRVLGLVRAMSAD